MFNSKKGFTLIELLIVIAILGTLAVVVLIALNPVQQLARTRDAGRIAAVTQLGHALEAYATSNGSVYPIENNTWITSLINSGEISTTPTNSAPTAPASTNKAPTAVCSGAGLGIQGNFCYNATTPATGGGPIVVYAALESAANNQRCAGTTVAFALYSSSDGRGGIVCAASYSTVIAPAAAGVITFLP